MDALLKLNIQESTLPSPSSNKDMTKTLGEERTIFDHEMASHFFFKKLMYFVAAEINNPLAIIGSHVHDMQACLEKNKGEPEVLFNGLKKISSSSERITKLFKHLKCISESGGQRAPAQFIFVKQIVSEVLELCQGRIFQHQIQVFQSVDPRLIVNVRAPEIMQIFMYLIENSIQANAHRSDGWLRVEAIAQEKMAVISIYDSGTGLKSWSFEQNSLHGLPVSSFLAKENGGQLGLVATDLGSKFVLKLPLA